MASRPTQDDDVVGTVLAVLGPKDPPPGPLAADSIGHQRITGVSEAFQALPAYSSEAGSLTMMQGFLYAISALVIVSFVTVWTIQRTRDLAILRALGASTGYLLKGRSLEAEAAVGPSHPVLSPGRGSGMYQAGQRSPQPPYR